jgi:flagellar biogenesis protein FliO
MLTGLVHLGVLGILAGRPVFIADARTSWDGDVFAVEVTGEESFGTRSVEPSLMGRVLVLAIDDTRVRAAKRAWGEGPGRVKAHRHDEFTELSTVLPAGATCGGPIRVTRTEAGALRAALSCAKGAAAPTAGPRGEDALRAAVRTPPSGTTAKTVTIRPPSPNPSPSPSPSPKSDPPARPGQAAAADAPARAAPIAAAPTAPVAPPPGERATASRSATAAPPPPPALAATPAASPRTAAFDLQVVALPLFALAAVAAFGWLRSRGRRSRGRLVSIVETASLGPKRALIVARVGNETLVLGASEAGISLLKAAAPAAETVPAPAPGPLAEGKVEEAFFAADPELVAAAADSPVSAGPSGETAPDEAEAPGQVRFLARLFSRRPRPAAAPADPEFASLLQESVEDRELRAKLAAGLGGRVA